MASNYILYAANERNVERRNCSVERERERGRENRGPKQNTWYENVLLAVVRMPSKGKFSTRAFSYKFPLTLIALNKQDCFNYTILWRLNQGFSFCLSVSIFFSVVLMPLPPPLSFVCIRFLCTHTHAHTPNILTFDERTTHLVRSYRCYTVFTVSFHNIFTYTGREQYWTLCLCSNVVVAMADIVVIVAAAFWRPNRNSCHRRIAISVILLLLLDVLEFGRGLKLFVLLNRSIN